MLTRRSFIRKSGTVAALSFGSYMGLKAGLIAGMPVGLTTGTVLDPFVQKPKILPQRLEKGNLIGLVTPGSPIKREQLDETIVKLENLGFKTCYRDSVLSEYGYFAGTDQERADELMHMFTNQEVDAIWCVRGGYGRWPWRRIAGSSSGTGRSMRIVTFKHCCRGWRRRPLPSWLSPGIRTSSLVARRSCWSASS